jgi:hypothetical protein
MQFCARGQRQRRVCFEFAGETINPALLTDLVANLILCARQQIVPMNNDSICSLNVSIMQKP